MNRRLLPIRRAWLAAPLLFGAACAEEPSAPISAPSVMAATVEAWDIVDRIEATGELLAEAEAEIAAQVGGQITEVTVEDGSFVEAGQVVIEIDPERRELEMRTQRASVAEADARVAEQERDTRRIRRLHSQGAASQATLDGAVTQLRLARAQLDAARAKLGLAERALRDSSIAAPFAGRIVRRYVNVGEFVSPGDRLFDLIDLDPLEVEFHLAEVDSSRVAIGAPVDVRVAPFPDERFRSEVTVISPAIDPGTRTLRVKARMANPEGRLRPGLFARADLGVSERTGVAMIPEEAILYRSDGPVVFRLLDDARVERIVIQQGVHRDGHVEVASGLAPGERVIVRGHTDLIDGSVVSLRNADGSDAGPSPANVAASIGGESGT